MLHQSIGRVVSESRMCLESSIEDLKMDFNRKISSLSSQLQSLYDNNSTHNPSLSRPRGPFNRKLFLPRESILSTMLHHDDENYKTIFNIALSVLFLWGIWLAIEDYEKLGAFNYDLLIWGIFRDLGPFFTNWLVMFIGSSFSVVFMAHFSAISTGFPTFPILTAIYATFQLSLFLFSWYVVHLRAHPFAMPIAMAFMAEQARMSMKVHAYYREKVLWSRFDGKFASAPQSVGPDGLTFLGLPFPQSDYLIEEIQKFGYFMVAPTLIYRDSYPRTSRIRWGYVLCRLAEFFGIVYYAFLIFRQVLPQFGVAIDQPITSRRFLRMTFRCM